MSRTQQDYEGLFTRWAFKPNFTVVCGGRGCGKTTFMTKAIALARASRLHPGGITYVSESRYERDAVTALGLDVKVLSMLDDFSDDPPGFLFIDSQTETQHVFERFVLGYLGEGVTVMASMQYPHLSRSLRKQVDIVCLSTRHTGNSINELQMKLLPHHTYQDVARAIGEAAGEWFVCVEVATPPVAATPAAPGASATSTAPTTTTTAAPVDIAALSAAVVSDIMRRGDLGRYIAAQIREQLVAGLTISPSPTPSSVEL